MIPSILATQLAELKHFTPTLDDVFTLNIEQRKISAFFREVFVRNKLAAIILPVFKATAVPHDTWGVPIYTALANLIDVGSSYT